MIEDEDEAYERHRQYEIDDEFFARIENEEQRKKDNPQDRGDSPSG